MKIELLEMMQTRARRLIPDAQFHIPFQLITCHYLTNARTGTLNRSLLGKFVYFRWAVIFVASKSRIRLITLLGGCLHSKLHYFLITIFSDLHQNIDRIEPRALLFSYRAIYSVFVVLDNFRLCVDAL